MHGSETPHKAFSGESILHTTIFRDVFTVIEVDKLIILHLPEGSKDGHSEKQADPEAKVCFGYFIHYSDKTLK
jgi:hypothetical protein